MRHSHVPRRPRPGATCTSVGSSSVQVGAATTMGLQSRLLVLIFCLNAAYAIPSSMIDEIKARELRPTKVKRVSMVDEGPEESMKVGNHYYGDPTAIKRGTEMKNEASEDESSSDSDWVQSQQGIYQDVDNDFQSTSYNDDTSQSVKSLDDYDKGFQYGGNREKFDEAIENAVLKSEFYGNLDNDKKKRKKRNSRMNGYGNSISSDDLSPEEVLDLLSLYEGEHQKPEVDIGNFDQDNAVWLDVPVRPGPVLPNTSNLGPSYSLDRSPMNYDRSRYPEDRNKRFMIAKKKNDPTRELRYLTGPTKHDYYFLSQLLNNRREANVPVFHRYVL